jgi:hypothetical protein
MHASGISAKCDVIVSKQSVKKVSESNGSWQCYIIPQVWTEPHHGSRRTTISWSRARAARGPVTRKLQMNWYVSRIGNRHDTRWNDPVFYLWDLKNFIFNEVMLRCCKCSYIYYWEKSNSTINIIGKCICIIAKSDVAAIPRNVTPAEKETNYTLHNRLLNHDGSFWFLKPCIHQSSIRCSAEINLCRMIPPLPRLLVKLSVWYWCPPSCPRTLSPRALCPRNSAPETTCPRASCPSTSGPNDLLPQSVVPQKF